MKKEFCFNSSNGQTAEEQSRHLINLQRAVKVYVLPFNKTV